MRIQPVTEAFAPRLLRSGGAAHLHRRMSLASPAPPLTRLETAPHIVDVLIAERAPKLAASPVWPLVRPLLYGLLDYAKARRMADAIAALPGRAGLEHVSHLLAL